MIIGGLFKIPEDVRRQLEENKLELQKKQKIINAWKKKHISRFYPDGILEGVDLKGVMMPENLRDLDAELEDPDALESSSEEGGDGHGISTDADTDSEFGRDDHDPFDIDVYVDRCVLALRKWRRWAKEKRGTQRKRRKAVAREKQEQMTKERGIAELEAEIRSEFGEEQVNEDGALSNLNSKPNDNLNLNLSKSSASVNTEPGTGMQSLFGADGDVASSGFVDVVDGHRIVVTRSADDDVG